MQSSAGARAFQNQRLQKKFKKQAEAIISAANAAFGQGRYAETEALCHQILNELPEHYSALHLLGLCDSQVSTSRQRNRLSSMP